MKTFKILKILFFIAISTFLLSCGRVIIEDTDGDGISDTANLVDEVYKSRETYTIQYNIGEYKSSRLLPTWYKPEGPLRTTPSSITKNNVEYTPLYDKYYIKGNTAAVYEITEGTGIGKFVFITLEPVPIFKEDMVILLVSKTIYDTADAAKTAAEAIDIPKIKMNLSHLDLVFNPTVPEADYLSYENVAENVAAILANYNLLEFFGTSYSYEEKQKLLSDYGYNTLFE